MDKILFGVNVDLNAKEVFKQLAKLEHFNLMKPSHSALHAPQGKSVKLNL
jgi:hypothetical protein